MELLVALTVLLLVATAALLAAPAAVTEHPWGRDSATHLDLRSAGSDSRWGTQKVEGRGPLWANTMDTHTERTREIPSPGWGALWGIAGCYLVGWSAKLTAPA